MRWTRTSADSRAGAFAAAAVGFCAGALIVCALLLQAQEKRVAVFTPQKYYSVNLIEIEGQDYLDLANYLEGLGRVDGKLDAKQWKFHFITATGERIEVQFENNKSKFKIRGKTFEMGQAFRIREERPYAPPHVLPELTTQLLRTQVEYHPAGRRLFVGATEITYTTELQRQPTPRLVVHFSAPVNPTISSEYGRVRMQFAREPVTGEPGTQSLGDPSLTASTFSESNGTAELTIAGAGPLVANVSDGGKTLTITAVPTQAAAPPAAAPPASIVTAPSTPAPATTPPTALRRLVVVIDPAHGGEETGAVFTDKLVEKDLTLVWARQLRAALDKQGVSSVMLREGDVTLSADQRAGAANGLRAAAFVTLHLGNSGDGVRLYTSRLPAAQGHTNGLIPWNTAQSGSLTASRSLADAIVQALLKRDIPAASGSAMLRPLNNVVAPAVAVEVMPADGDLASLSRTLYQQSVCSALAEALAALRKPEATP